MIRKQVKDFEIGEKIECIVFTKGKNRRRIFKGEVVERGGRKHLVGYQIPTCLSKLSFGPGTILEFRDESDYKRRKTTPWRYINLVGFLQW